MGKRVVNESNTVSVSEVCEADDLIVAYKHNGDVYHLVGVYTPDGGVQYAFHPFAAQGHPEFTQPNCDDSVCAAVKVRELMAFETPDDFLDWVCD